MINKDERIEKFSPGKWEVVEVSNGELWILSDRCVVVAWAQGNSGNVGIFNARLIAAAPEMYEALNYCYAHIRDAAQCGVDISAFYGEMEWRIREALEKARGEE